MSTPSGSRTDQRRSLSSTWRMILPVPGGTATLSCRIRKFGPNWAIESVSFDHEVHSNDGRMGAKSGNGWN